MQDLGTLGGTVSQAKGINCSGVIVGFSTLQSDTQTDAFIDQGGTMTDIKNLRGSSSHAIAINDSGLVVGFSDTTGDADVHAFRWTSTGKIDDLNDRIPANCGWDLNSANSVRKRGEIVGNGIHNGAFHAFVLVPGFS
jgi:probable HAF family extracellular repeat protein